jgi:hypothetical protein
MDQLKMWLSEPHPVGPDAADAKDVLGDYIGDDNLFDQLEELAEEDPDADAVPLVMAWIDRNRDGFAEIAELAQNLEAAAAPAAQPAPPPAADAAAPQIAPGPQAVAESDLFDSNYKVMFVDSDGVVEDMGKVNTPAEATELIQNHFDDIFDTGDRLRKVAPNIFVLETDYTNTGERATLDNYKDFYHWIIRPEQDVAEDTVSPRLAGVQQTQHADGSQTTDYQQGPLQATNKVDAQGRPLKTTVGYDLGVGKVGAEQDHVTGIRTTTATPADPNADPNALLPTTAIAAARGVDPTKFAAFQAQQPGVVKEDPDTGMYESDLARIKSLASLKLSEAGESFGDAYLQKAASGAPGRWMISQDQAKAELARRAAGGAQTVSAPEPAVSSEPFVPKDYQTKEPLTKGPDGKWYNKAGQERDGLRGYPLTAQGTAQFRSLVPPAPAAPVNEEDYTDMYESDLARIKSLALLLSQKN